jgi:hypothetical protein
VGEQDCGFAQPFGGDLVEARQSRLPGSLKHV